MTNKHIPALVPQNSNGHQFVCYADSCSGVPNAQHEAKLAAVNAVIARLVPQPEFICFPGDEIIGLTASDEELYRQWDHWFSHEMNWLDRTAISLYHTTGNHTTYDVQSETIYQQVMAHLPQNGPPDQKSLSYFVRRGNLLMIFVNTMWSGLGGEGRVETQWLEQVLADHADAAHKLVFGHHPVHPVNGFSGAYQREIAPDIGAIFWQILVQHNVLAYVCSHILAFDVQVHQGVLQILTAGAGTAHRMPEEIEYLHCMQAALDATGLRYQVLDIEGAVREWLAWPLPAPAATDWEPLPAGVSDAPMRGAQNVDSCTARFIIWHFTGTCAIDATGIQQTLLSAWDSGPELAPLWIGLSGPENRLCVLLSPTPGRSPHLWIGPVLASGQPFDVQIAIHTGMGPGGVLWRWRADAPWSSMTGATAWGAERLNWPEFWGVGHGQRGSDERPFLGQDLRLSWTTQILRLRLS